MSKLDQIPAAAPELEITKMSDIEKGALQNKDEMMDVKTSDGGIVRIPKADFDKFLEDYKNSQER